MLVFMGISSFFYYQIATTVEFFPKKNSNSQFARKHFAIQDQTACDANAIGMKSEIYAAEALKASRKDGGMNCSFKKSSSAFILNTQHHLNKHIFSFFSKHLCCFRSTLGEFPNGNSLFLGEIKHVSFLYQYFIRLSALIVLKEETGLIRASQNLVLMRGIFNKTLLNTRGYCF